jgi:hypothetical protein
MVVEINIFAVVVAAVVNIILGALWYSPAVFGKQWMSLTGVSQHAVSSKAPNVWKYYVIGLVNSLVMALALAYVLALAVPTLMYGFFIAFLLWFGFVGTISMNAVTWGRRDQRLWFLDNGYYLLSFLVMSAIIYYL